MGEAVELTQEQRETLRGVVLAAQARVYGVDAVRPASADAFDNERKNRADFREAWTGLRPSTADWLRWRIAERVLDALERKHLIGDLTEDERQLVLVDLSETWEPFPLDLRATIDECEAAMTRDARRPEKTPGLGQACRMLWVIWRDSEPSDEISRAACKAIATEVAELFAFGRAEALRRVRIQLRYLDEIGDLPRRKGGPER